MKEVIKERQGLYRQEFEHDCTFRLVILPLDCLHYDILKG